MKNVDLYDLYQTDNGNVIIMREGAKPRELSATYKASIPAEPVKVCALLDRFPITPSVRYSVYNGSYERIHIGPQVFTKSKAIALLDYLPEIEHYATGGTPTRGEIKVSKRGLQYYHVPYGKPDRNGNQPTVNNGFTRQQCRDITDYQAYLECFVLCGIPSSVTPQHETRITGNPPKMLEGIRIASVFVEVNKQGPRWYSYDLKLYATLPGSQRPEYLMVRNGIDSTLIKSSKGKKTTVTIAASVWNDFVDSLPISPSDSTLLSGEDSVTKYQAYCARATWRTLHHQPTGWHDKYYTAWKKAYPLPYETGYYKGWTPAYRDAITKVIVFYNTLVYMRLAALAAITWMIAHPATTTAEEPDRETYNGTLFTKEETLAAIKSRHTYTTTTQAGNPIKMTLLMEGHNADLTATNQTIKLPFE